MRGRIRGFAYRNRSRAVSASLSLSLAFTFCSRTIIPNHDDFVEGCFQRDFFRLKRTFRRLHNQRPALPSSRQIFYEHVPLFQTKGFEHSVSCIADKFCKRHFQLAQSSGRFRRLEIAGRRRNCPLRVAKRDLGGLPGHFTTPDAVLKSARASSKAQIRRSVNALNSGLALDETGAKSISGSLRVSRIR
jgi:hypothetical protein